MADNPFAGTEFELSWHQGFVAGYLVSDEEHPAPSPLTVDQQTAYAEGVLAGQEAVRGFSVPAGTNDQEESWGEILHDGAEIVHLGHTAKELIAREVTLAGAAGGMLIFTFATIATWGPTRLPFLDEAAARSISRVRRQLIEEGLISNDTELFMAACNRTDHEHDRAQDDDLTRQGWWHGKVFLSFEEALSEGQEHEHPDETRVLRFQSGAPDVIEVIELN